MVFSSTLNKDDRTKANPLNVTILEEFAVDQCSPDKSLKEMNEWCSSLRDSTCKLNGCCNLLSGPTQKLNVWVVQNKVPRSTMTTNIIHIKANVMVKVEKNTEKNVPIN